MYDYSEAEEAFIASQLDAFEMQLRCCLGDYCIAFAPRTETPVVPTQIVELTLAVGGWEHAIVPGSFLFITRQLDESEQAYYERYRKWFHANLRYPEFKNSVQALKGKRIAILGYPKQTIADIVKEYLDDC